VGVAVELKGGVYTLVECDNRDKNFAAACMCYFDTYCEIDGIDAGEVKFNYELLDFTIDLAQQDGIVIIDTSRFWPCP
jgi:hypothetical protein